MALVVIGLFVMVWIISAVVKATQSNGPAPRPGAAPNRQRPAEDNPRVERTSNTDIDRFMAEIDRLRNRGEGAPAGRRTEQPQPRPVGARPAPPPPPEPRPRSGGTTRREKERRPRAIQRTVAPPPLPAPDPVPVLKPLSADTAPSTPSAPVKPVRPATTAQVGHGTPLSPVSVILQNLLRSKQGPAAAVILAEIFSEPPGKRGLVRGPHSHPHG